MRTGLVKMYGTIGYPPAWFPRRKTITRPPQGRVSSSRRESHLCVPMDGILLDMVRSEVTLALPLGELAAPKGQTERVPRSNGRFPTIKRSTLSVSLFG